MSERESLMPDATLLSALRFDAARDAEPAAKTRVLGRLETTLGALGAVGAAGAGSLLRSSTTIARGPRASGVEPMPASLARAWRPRFSAGSALWGVAAKPAALIAGAFLLGGFSGAGIYAVLTPPRTRTVYIERPVAVPEPRPLAFDAWNRSPDIARRETDAPEAAKGRASAAPTVSPMAAERELLDRARKALASGDTPQAERALELHARRHPTGLLLEEREALAIKVLVDGGRAEEARRRAVKFKERYPHSLFGPSVDEAIGTIR